MMRGKGKGKKSDKEKPSKQKQSKAAGKAAAPEAAAAAAPSGTDAEPQWLADAESEITKHTSRVAELEAQLDKVKTTSEAQAGRVLQLERDAAERDLLQRKVDELSRAQQREGSAAAELEAVRAELQRSKESEAAVRAEE